MSDKLKYLDEHRILLKYQSMKQCTSMANYKIPLTLGFSVDDDGLSCEQYLAELIRHGCIKPGLEFLSYAMHPRMALYWAYRCVLSLYEELEENPVCADDLSQVGEKKELAIPKWAQDQEDPKMPNDMEKRLNDTVDSLQELISVMESRIPPEIKIRFDKAIDNTFDAYAKKFGKRPDEILKESMRSLEQFDDDPKIEPELLKQFDEINNKLRQCRQDTLELLSQALPNRDPKLKAALKLSCMDSAYAFLCAPTAQNAQKALDCANQAPDTPEGMLSYVAFWSWGNLTPLGTQVIKTPPGLAPNGMNSLLLMCALHKGGTRKFKERLSLYLDLGLECASGKQDFAALLDQKLPPHHRYSTGAHVNQDPDNKSVFTRFKAEDSK